jgi:hypothetical protein
MNWIQKIVCFIGLSVIFVFAFNADQTTIDKNPMEKSTSAFTDESIHSSVFIQPQSSTPFTLNSKTSDYTISKWFENFLIATPDFKVIDCFNAFLNQDINRFEKVLLLLYPFHYFW